MKVNTDNNNTKPKSNAFTNRIIDFNLKPLNAFSDLPIKLSFSTASSGSTRQDNDHKSIAFGKSTSILSPNLSRAKLHTSHEVDASIYDGHLADGIPVHPQNARRVSLTSSRSIDKDHYAVFYSKKKLSTSSKALGEANAFYFHKNLPYLQNRVSSPPLSSPPPSSSSPSTKIHMNADSTFILKTKNADAMTIGNNIFIKYEKFNLRTPKGIALLFHELTHVRQFKEKKVNLQKPDSRNTFSNSGLIGNLEKEALENENLVMNLLYYKQKRNRLHILRRNPNFNFNYARKKIANLANLSNIKLLITHEGFKHPNTTKLLSTTSSLYHNPSNISKTFGSSNNDGPISNYSNQRFAKDILDDYGNNNAVRKTIDEIDKTTVPILPTPHSIDKKRIK